MLYTSPIHAVELLKEFIPLQDRPAAYMKAVALTMKYMATNGASAAVRRGADPTCLGTCAYLTNKGKHCGRAVPEEQIAHMLYLQCEYKPLMLLLKGRALCHTHEETLFGKIKQGDPQDDQDHEDGDEKVSKNENAPIMHVGLFTNGDGTSVNYVLSDEHSDIAVDFMKVRPELLSKCIERATKKKPTTTAGKQSHPNDAQDKVICTAMVLNGTRQCRNTCMEGFVLCKTHQKLAAKSTGGTEHTGRLSNVKNVETNMTKTEYKAALERINNPEGGSSGHGDNKEGEVTHRVDKVESTTISVTNINLNDDDFDNEFE